MTPTMLGAINAIALLQTTMSFVTIARGDLSGVDEPRQVVIRTVEEWQALWTEHSGGTSVPDVDFSRSLVAGVFQGSRPTAGFQVEITGVHVERGAWWLPSTVNAGHRLVSRCPRSSRLPST